LIVTDDRVAEYVGYKINRTIYPPFVCIGMERQGRIVSGVVFNCYTGPDIEATVAADHGGISRRLLRCLGLYAFDYQGCSRVSLTTESAEVANLALRVGASVEGYREEFFGPGRAAILLGILRNKWKFPSSELAQTLFAGAHDQSRV
jgi:hypothetical protein